MASKRTSVESILREVYEPQIQRDYGLSFDEFGAYVEAHQGEMPPFKDGVFGNLPACWPHFHCTHP